MTSINTPEPSSDLIILIISFISSFEINKLTPLPALTAHFPHIFLPNLSITFGVAFEAKLLTNTGMLSLAKGIAKYVMTYLSNFSPILPKLHPNENPPE